MQKWYIPIFYFSIPFYWEKITMQSEEIIDWASFQENLNEETFIQRIEVRRISSTQALIRENNQVIISNDNSLNFRSIRYPNFFHGICRKKGTTLKISLRLSFPVLSALLFNILYGLIHHWFYISDKIKWGNITQNIVIWLLLLSISFFSQKHRYMKGFRKSFNLYNP